MPRTSVFISYSRRDKRWLDQIKEFLAPVVRDRVDQWDDTRTPPGAKWFEEIQRALDSASVAVLLVSQHFLSSEFILQEELPKLLEAAGRGELTIIWVPVSASSYKSNFPILRRTPSREQISLIPRHRVLEPALLRRPIWQA